MQRLQAQNSNSGNIVSYGFNPHHNPTILEVEFKGGRVYRYAGPTLEEYRDLANAPSAGQFLNEVIKPKYPAERIL